MDFDQAFERVIGHEGGYVNDPRDPGGETRYGISRRAYPGEDIAGMTLGRAREIYRRDYWGPAGCEDLPDGLRLEVFDTAVNMGVGTSIKLLQRALGVPDDGVIGPVTRLRLQVADQARILRRLQGARLDAYTRAKAWPTFGAGWVRRVARNMLEVS